VVIVGLHGRKIPVAKYLSESLSQSVNIDFAEVRFPQLALEERGIYGVKQLMEVALQHIRVGPDLSAGFSIIYANAQLRIITLRLQIVALCEVIREFNRVCVRSKFEGSGELDH
jgi:hypothetical protein